MKCECGKELKKITVNHLNSQYHNLNVNNSKVIEMNIVSKAENNKSVLLSNEVKEKLINENHITVYNSDEFVDTSSLSDNKIDDKGNYIIAKNKRRNFRKTPKRLIVVFYSRNSNNSYTISDNSDKIHIIIDNRLITLKRVAYFNEGIPVYFVILTWSASISLEFSEGNEKLQEKCVSPDEALNYIESQAVEYMYDDKKKINLTWNQIGYTLLITALGIFIALIIAYGVWKGYA